MNTIEPIPATHHNQTLWDFEAQDFPLPDDSGIGRMQYFAFGHGWALYRS